MKVLLFKQKYVVVILFCLIITNICIAQKEANNNKDCYDVESFKGAFKNIANSTWKVSLSKELEFNTKSLSEIKSILGEPNEEYLDTFNYGDYVTNRDLRTDHHYYPIQVKLKKIRRLIIRTCVWGKGKKDITLFFAKDCNNGEQPFWGYVQEYDDLYTPFRLLPEKDLTINQVINKRGKPKYESIYNIRYGVEFRLHTDIYSLRNVPKASVHSYSWDVDGTHTLVLIYLENEDKEKSKPIGGMLCNNWWLDYE